MAFFHHPILALSALWIIRFGIAVPLSLGCLVLIVVIPSAARRGKLSVPIYALLAFATGAAAFVIGKIAGAESVRGTALGIVLSIIFFLLIAALLGCLLSLFFYRHHPSDLEQSEAVSQDNKNAQ